MKVSRATTMLFRVDALSESLDHRRDEVGVDLEHGQTPTSVLTEDRNEAILGGPAQRASPGDHVLRCREFSGAAQHRTLLVVVHGLAVDRIERHGAHRPDRAGFPGRPFGLWVVESVFAEQRGWRSAEMRVEILIQAGEHFLRESIPTHDVTSSSRTMFLRFISFR